MEWQKFRVACPEYLASLQKNAALLCSHSISANTSTSFVQPRYVSPCRRDVSVLLVPWFLTSLYLSVSITQFYSFSQGLFFIIVIPFLFLFFCQSPRIRCSIVSSIVAVVGSITTRGSPGTSEFVQLETKKWSYHAAKFDHKRFSFSVIQLLSALSLSFFPMSIPFRTEQLFSALLFKSRELWRAVNGNC